MSVSSCKERLKLYKVSDGRMFYDDISVDKLDDIIEDDVAIVQLCQRDLEHDEFISLAEKFRDVCCEYKILFTIKNDIEAVVEVEADGVYLDRGSDKFQKAKEELGDDKIVGVEIEDVTEILDAFVDGIDYVGVNYDCISDCKNKSYIATTANNDSTKKHCSFVERLKFLCSVSPLPVMVNATNVDKLTDKNICKCVPEDK